LRVRNQTTFCFQSKMLAALGVVYAKLQEFQPGRTGDCSP
jgi:hypothetical protein